MINNPGTNRYVFKQGEQGRIYFQLIIDGKLYLDNLVENVEVCIDRVLRKTLNNGELFYHKDMQAYSFVLSQEETMWLKPRFYASEIRVKFKNFDTTGYNFIHTIYGPEFEILPGFSKEII